jgi:hypothetical protein
MNDWKSTSSLAPARFGSRNQHTDSQTQDPTKPQKLKSDGEKLIWKKDDEELGAPVVRRRTHRTTSQRIYMMKASLDLRRKKK